MSWIRLVLPGLSAVVSMSSVRAQCDVETLAGACSLQPCGLFGESVDLDGERAVIGQSTNFFMVHGPGAAYVYERTPNGWTPGHEIQPASPDPDEDFGMSVAVSGDVVAVGAPGDTLTSDPGAVFLFERTVNGWEERQKLNGTPVSDYGRDVDLEGDTLVVGAPFFGAGRVYVYERSGPSWTLADTLAPSDGVGGDQFGQSVSLSGDTLLVGAPMRDDGCTNQCQRGAAYVFVHTPNGWVETQKLTPSVPANKRNFGYDVALDGTRAVIGAPYVSHGGPPPGEAYVFEEVQLGWIESERIDAPDPSPASRFGRSVSVDGDTVLVGAPDDDESGTETGAVYTFRRTTAGWTFVSKLSTEIVAAHSSLGRSVSVDGGLVLVSRVSQAASFAHSFPVPELVGARYCSTNPNSSGESARIDANGDATAGSGCLRLFATRLPLGQLGYFLASQTTGFVPMPGGSQGNLCLGGSIVRFSQHVLDTDDGFFQLPIDLSSGLPSVPVVPVLAGETWNFQAWFRDLNPQSTSNFTDGLAVSFL